MPKATSNLGKSRNLVRQKCHKNISGWNVYKTMGNIKISKYQNLLDMKVDIEPQGKRTHVSYFGIQI